MKIITILLVSGHGLLRDGLMVLMQREDDLQVVGVESIGLDALRVAAASRPQIVLVDSTLSPIGLDHLLRSLPTAAPESRVILLSSGLESAEAARIIQLGVRGMVDTAASSAVVFKCIRTVMAGEYWFGRELFSELARIVVDGSGANTVSAPKYNLSPREYEVLGLVASGGTNKGVAGQLNLSIVTVKHHVTSIFDKVGVSSRTELAIFAMNNGLI